MGDREGERVMKRNVKGTGQHVKIWMKWVKAKGEESKNESSFVGIHSR